MALLEKEALINEFFNQPPITKLDQALDFMAQKIFDDYKNQSRQGQFRIPVTYQEIINLPCTLAANLPSLIDNVIRSNEEIRRILEQYITIALRHKCIMHIIKFWQAYDTAFLLQAAAQRIKHSIILEEKPLDSDTIDKLHQQQARDEILIQNIEQFRYYQTENLALTSIYNSLRAELLSKVQAAPSQLEGSDIEVHDLSASAGLSL